MTEDLLSLLNVAEEEFLGLLEEYQPGRPCTDCESPFHFFYIRFQDDLPRTSNFVSKLCDHIVPFCLTRERYRNIAPTNARRIVMEAKRKFAQPKNGMTGEPGELILYFLLEGHMRCPKILSKMSLKTNANVHVHGADGVHLGIDGDRTVLYFGESKLHQDVTDGIAAAIDSVQGFVAPTTRNLNYSRSDFEITVVSEHLDLPIGPLRDRVLDVLDPYSAQHSNLINVHACFIGFNIQALTTRCLQDDFLMLYEEQVHACYAAAQRKINSDPILVNQRWHFFFLPLDSVEGFRKRFLDELNS